MDNTSNTKARPPPIILHVSSGKETIKVLSARIKDFYVKRINTNKQVLYIKALKDQKSACEILKENDIKSTYTPQKPKDLFPSINKLYRPKDNNRIDTLLITNTNKLLLKDANLNVNNLTTDKDENILIADTSDKLNILGAHFQSVHKQ